MEAQLAERVDVYSYYPRQLVGTIARYNLRAIGLTAASNQISATKGQLRVFEQQPTWEPAGEK
jgi:hypothetical protein